MPVLILEFLPSGEVGNGLCEETEQSRSKDLEDSERNHLATGIKLSPYFNNATALCILDLCICH